MGKADLHTHTVYSDGLYTPDIVMRKAKAKGISLISITDHDSISHISEERELAKKLGLEFIPGCEVSAFQNGKNYHILALNFDPDVKSFIEHFEEYEIERTKRAEIIAQKFTKLGMKISIDEIIEQSGNSPIGRPHIARAIVKAGYAQDQREVFAKYLYDNFNLKIPNSLHYYIVIPNNGCRLCMDNVINQIELLGKKLDSNIVTIIVSNLGCINDSLFKNNVNCYFDNTDNISDLNLPIVNVTIIHTSKEKIDSINSLDATKSYFIQKLLVH